jgi:ubiquinone/menaquinone biosynthesis C-methylase UbiE
VWNGLPLRVLDSAAMAAPATKTEILDVNRRYHDVAADEYDAKWGISFAETGQEQVVGKLSKLLGARPGPYARSLEIGAGTGYFSLNMLQAGVVGAATCTDISPGMLMTLESNAARLGLDVETAACDAAALPFEDESFDLVFGHAVLHHLPDLDRAFAEFHRVLRPGGTLFFAGEPSRQGDRIAAVPKRVAWRLSPAWRAALRVPRAPHLNGHPRADGDDHHLESQVDVHAFVPSDLERHAAAAGFTSVRVRGEELLANWFGWFNRTLEASADPKGIPMPWIRYAYRGYLVLQGVDRRLLEGRLPPQLFYNLMLAAAKPQ